MIQQLILYGFIEEAYEHILPMVKRVKENDGFYEWYTIDNEPRGAGTFRGSAGVLFKALRMFEELESLSFVQLCDPQLGMGRYEQDKATFKQAVKQINALDVDFVVICGDFVHHSSDSSFADYIKIRNGLNKPFYEVPGNHDIGRVPNDTTPAIPTGGDFWSRFISENNDKVVMNFRDSTTGFVRQRVILPS